MSINSITTTLPQTYPLKEITWHQAPPQEGTSLPTTQVITLWVNKALANYTASMTLLHLQTV